MWSEPDHRPRQVRGLSEELEMGAQSSMATLASG